MRRTAGYILLDRKKSGYAPRTQGRSNYGFCPGIQEILERTCYQNEQQQIAKKKKSSSMFLVAKEVW
jgi:hypothetical protein